MSADHCPSVSVVKRLGKSPRNRALLCGLKKTCPDILLLSTGDYAIIGKDITAEFTPKLPEDAGCGSDERIILVPREVLIAARADLPER